MHQRRIVSFQITSGAQVLPSRSGFSGWHGHACQTSPSSEAGSRLRLFSKRSQWTRSVLRAQRRCVPKM